MTQQVSLHCEKSSYEGKLSQSTLVDIEALDDAKCGFCRDIGADRCRGDLKKFAAHVVVCTDTPATEWASKLGGSSAPEDLVRRLSKALPRAAKVSLVNLSGFRSCDVLVFLPGARVQVKRSAAVTDAVGIAEAVASGSGLEELPAESVFVLVCAHAKRDDRCGLTGPVLADLAQQHLAKNKSAHVGKISHVGGHAYAGNVLMYDSAGLDWFGYVNPDKLASVLDRVWDDSTLQRWRGRIGFSSEELMEGLPDQKCAVC